MNPVFVVDGSRTPFLKARGVPGPFSPVDLAVSLGRDSAADEEVASLCREAIGKASPHACAGLFLANTGEIAAWRDAGASLVVSGTDHSLLRSGAGAIAARVIW